MGRTVLIADDDSAIRTVLNQAFARAGYAPRATGNAATLWRWVAQGEGDDCVHLFSDTASADARMLNRWWLRDR